MQAFPESTIAFHWPRLDFDQLLCIRLMLDKTTQWSGGFAIDSVDSFHVTVRHRDDTGRGIFVRVEVAIVGATFCVVFSDASNFPPPFRIDNFSEVSVTYFQSGINQDLLRSYVKPHHSVPYALDEPILPPYLTLSAPGGSTETYNMNVIGSGETLTYENFIYIAMSATFETSKPLDGLVLDVDGTRVILSRKEAGKRSQLWRMTPTGMLQHEGSSPTSRSQETCR